MNTKRKKVKVAGHRVLLKPRFDHEEIQEGALKGFQMDVGETFKREKAATVVGEVVAIGKMAWKAFDGDSHDWEPWCKVGDIVYFAKYGGKFITVNEEDFIIVNDEDIQGVLEDE
jgi:co-chaperonin GroES (HSP10)